MITPFNTLVGIPSPFGGSSWLDAYKREGSLPAMVASFFANKYFNDGATTTFDSLLTFTRTTTKPMWDANGDIVLAAINEVAIAYDPVTLDNLGKVSEPEITRLNAYPECKDGTGWLDVGATSTNLALDVFDAFGGVRVESLGATWHRLKMSPSEYVTLAASNVYPFTFIYKAGDVTPSDEVRCLIENTTAATNSDISGAIGAVSITGTGAGSLSNVSEVLHADGETYILTGYITALANGDYSFDTGPNSTTSGETVIAVAAFIGGAGEKLPHCPIIGNDGFVETVAKDVMSFEAVPSEIELVTNGGFDTDLTGWTHDGIGASSSVSSKLEIDATLGNTSDYQEFAVVIGRTYRVSLGEVSNGYLYAYDDAGYSNLYGGFPLTSVGYIDVVPTFASTLRLRAFVTSGNTGVFDAISVQELVPFVGYNADAGTWVLLGRWKHNAAITTYMLAGDANTVFVGQGPVVASRVKAFDGTTTTSKTGVFTDNTDTVIVMSWETGGNFDILVDGSTEASTTLTGDLATTSIGVFNLAGGGNVHGIAKELVYYPAKHGLTTRQGETA